LVLVREESVPNNVPAFVAPILADYRAHLNRSTPSSDTAADAGNTRADDETTPYGRFDALLKRFGLYTPDRSLEFIHLDYEELGPLETGLEEFTRDHPLDESSLAWYLDTAKEKWDRNAAEMHDVERKRELAAVIARNRREGLLLTIGSAFVTLLAFLFLPLLIQVEQNTRRTLEVQAAMKKGLERTVQSDA
jgi:hypothetical protein